MAMQQAIAICHAASQSLTKCAVQVPYHCSRELGYHGHVDGDVAALLDPDALQVVGQLAHLQSDTNSCS